MPQSFKLSTLLQSRDSQAIQTHLRNSFANNLTFFSSLNPKLYDALILPPQRYNLFVDEDGLNIINLQNQALIYPQDPQTKRHLMVEAHLDLATSPLQNQKYSLTHNNLYLQKMNIDTFPITGGACNAMFDILDSLGGVREFHLPQKFLPCTTLFGTLGGLFLEFLREEGTFFHSLLLFEEEIDFFRISCYFVDYSKLFEQCSDRSCYLFIQDLMSKDIIRHYFETHKVTNNFLRLELVMYDSLKIQSARAVIQEAQAQNSRGWGSFEDEMIGFVNTLQNLSKPYPILSRPKRVDMPICVVGNGASLDELIPFIRDNQEKMIILSCGTALKVLKNYGINPDFQIEIERISYLADVLEGAPLGDTPLICGNMINPNAIALAKEAYMFMRGGCASSYLHSPKFVLELSSPFVGNAGVALASMLGSDVILCGMDCGYIQGRSKHAKGSYYGEEEVAIPSDAFEVKGNKEARVFTTSIYALSSKMMSLAIKYYKPNTAINLGSGAYIDHTLSLDLQAFVLQQKDKKQAIKQIKECFLLGKENVFTTQSEIQEIFGFLSTLKKSLSCQVNNKQDLFILIDEINMQCFAKSASSPFVGVLIEGSIYHLLQTLMMCALHYPYNDISPLYMRCLDELKSALDKMAMKVRMLHSTLFF